MIGRLSGVLVHRGLDHVLIDVRGVGYVVHVTDRTLAALPRLGEAVTLHTDLLVREDLLQLFGFPTPVEKEWHRLLMTVQGVGARASLAILGALGADGLSRALALGDAAAISRAKGVGPKTAARVVMELKGKAPGIMAMAGADALVETLAPAEPTAAPSAPAPRRRAAAPDPDAVAQSEALSALTNLGYAPSDAAGAVAQAAQDTPGQPTPALIRAALKLLAPRG